MYVYVWGFVWTLAVLLDQEQDPCWVPSPKRGTHEAVHRILLQMSYSRLPQVSLKWSFAMAPLSWKSNAHKPRPFLAAMPQRIAHSTRFDPQEIHSYTLHSTHAKQTHILLKPQPSFQIYSSACTLSSKYKQCDRTPLYQYVESKLLFILEKNLFSDVASVGTRWSPM